MTWFNFEGMSINIDRFVFYDKSADSEAALCTPRGHVCFLTEEHCKQVDCLMRGNPGPSLTVPGLASLDHREPWVLVNGGAVHMALADMVVTDQAGQVTVHGGVYTRVYKGEDAKRINEWLCKNGRPAR